MIPKSFPEWKDCIENKCNIQLESQFIEDRLRSYTNESNPETIKFKQLYGEEHLRNVISWLEKARSL